MSELQENVAMTKFTKDHFRRRLEERVSGYNAKLLLDAAVLESGISSNDDQQLDSDQAKSLCLSLINRGGPAFHVGQSVYKELVQ